MENNRPAKQDTGLARGNQKEIEIDSIEENLDGCKINMNWSYNKKNILSLNFYASVEIEEGFSIHVQCMSVSENLFWNCWDKHFVMLDVKKLINTIKKACHLKCFPSKGDYYETERKRYEVSSRTYKSSSMNNHLELHYHFIVESPKSYVRPNQITISHTTST